MEKDIIDLLIKKHGEGLTPQEATLLQQWNETSGKNKAFSRLATAILHNTRDPENEEITVAWQKLHRQMQQTGKQKYNRKNYILWGSLAASLVIIFGVAFSLLFTFTDTEKNFSEIRTLYGQTSSTILPDGSQVWLAGGTTLKYSLNFEGKNRLVELKGEAFFDVCKGKGEFTVVTGETRTIVKGTRFNVKAYPEDDQIETTLIEGKVCFISQKQEISLQPEEKVVYNKPTGTMTKNPVIYPNCCIDDEFRFDNQRMEEVMLYLKRLYNVEVNFENENLKDLHYSGVIRKSNTIGHTLEVITTTLDLMSELSGDTIFLKEK